MCFRLILLSFWGFDFLIGGSPCTYWSIAQKNNRETEASGMGWELFSQYVRALHEAKPMFFIYENNKSMSKAIRQSITEIFGFEPICINSALVSAQNRQRLYWVGKRNPDGTYSRVRVEQPADRGILLRDVLDGVTDREKGRCVLTSIGRTTTREYFKKDQGNMAFEPVDIGYIARSEDGKLVNQYKRNGPQQANILTTAQTDNIVTQTVSEPLRVGTYPSNAKNQAHDSQQYRIYSTEGKGVTLCGNGGGMGAKTGLYAVPLRVGEIGNGGQGNRIYSVEGKSVSQTATSGGIGSNTGLYAIPVEFDGDVSTKAISGADGKTYPVYQVKDGQITIQGKKHSIKLADGFYIIRKLTVSECKRLQTVPEWYEFPVSGTQAYKMLGNGWTVAVIEYLIRATQCNQWM